jgi:hypothetical protein
MRGDKAGSASFISSMNMLLRQFNRQGCPLFLSAVTPASNSPSLFLLSVVGVKKKTVLLPNGIAKCGSILFALSDGSDYELEVSQKVCAVNQESSSLPESGLVPSYHTHSIPLIVSAFICEISGFASHSHPLAWVTKALTQSGCDNCATCRLTVSDILFPRENDGSEGTMLLSPGTERDDSSKFYFVWPLQR